MFTTFVLSLRQTGMQAGVADYSVEDSYLLARASPVKDERHLDRFDRVFAPCFKGLETPVPTEGAQTAAIPAEWRRAPGRATR